MTIEYVRLKIEDLDQTQNPSEKNSIVQSVIQEIGQKNDYGPWKTLFEHVCSKESPQVILKALETLVDTYLLGLKDYAKLCDLIINQLEGKNNAGSNIGPVLFKIKLYAAEAKALQVEKPNDQKDNDQKVYDLLQSNMENTNSQENQFLARQYVLLAYCAFTRDEIKKIHDLSDREKVENLQSYIVGVDAYKKCATYSKEIKDQPSTGLFLRSEYMIVDAIFNELQRNWHKAADKYYNLSNTSIIDKPLFSKYFSNSFFLSKAISCVILTPPNKMRQRMVSKLLEDNRVSSFSVKVVLRKIFDNLLIMSDRQIITQSIFPPNPQKGKSSSSSSSSSINPLKDFFFPASYVSALPLALLQQDVVSVAQLFDNITIKNLAEILKVKDEEAMEAAYSLFSDGTIAGKIDQVQGVLLFKTESTLKNWNSRIEEACVRINEVADEIHVLTEAAAAATPTKPDKKK